MKRYSLIGLLLILAAVAVSAAVIEVPEAPARMTTVVVGGGGVAVPTCADSSCTGFLVCENFETATTGYDDPARTWTESGTVEAAYTTTALRGAQSLYIAEDNAYTWCDSFGATNPVYGFFRLRVVTNTVAGPLIFILKTAAGADVAGIVFEASGGDPVLKIKHGVTSAGTTLTAWDTPTTYYVWWDYTAETGEGVGDGIMNLYVGTTTTKPAATLTITNGTQVDSIGRILISAKNSLDLIVDQVLVDNQAIGDVCE